MHVALSFIKDMRRRRNDEGSKHTYDIEQTQLLK